MNDKCGAKTRSGGTCKQPAGWGTQHVGEGRCKLHGGNAGRPIIHGRYSVKHREKLAENIHKFLNDPSPGDLTAELALNRALLQDFIDKFPDGVRMTAKEIDVIFAMTDAIGRTVERISRILNQTALTQADLSYLRAVLSDLLIRYIDDPEKRIRFLGELREAFGRSNTTRTFSNRQIDAPAE